MKKFFTALLLFTYTQGFNQTAMDTLNNKVAHMDSTLNRIGKLLNILSEFRIVAYAQVQWQLADTAGIRSTAGGDFPVASNNRFSIRRGRIKLGYDHYGKKGFKLYEMLFHMDMSERGFMTRDFYGRIIDPWTGWFSIQAGMMTVPFGYETRTADDTRESPERAKLTQVIIPAEKDIGAEIVIESPRTFKPFYLKFDAGLFNGTRDIASSFSSRKDFVTSIKAAKTVGKDIKFTIAGGASWYHGFALQTARVYGIEPNALGQKVYTLISDTDNINKRYFGRNTVGFDVQMILDYKLGTTTLRGEYMQGQLPGTATSSVMPIYPGSNLFVRKYNGCNFYFIQTFHQPIKNGQVFNHDIVIRYDLFNPNTQVVQKDLNSTIDSRVSYADVLYHTFGIGYNFRPTEYLWLMLYYDIPVNSKTNVSGFTSDLRDNVLTVRTQFKFDTDWFNRKVKAEKF